MKVFKIDSPAYRANGLKGMYYSIVICEDNNIILDIIGDHSNLISEYKKITDIIGIDFTDSDRYISVKEVTIEMSILEQWKIDYKEFQTASNNWLTIKNDKFGDVYQFIYGTGKKGILNIENESIYNKWLIDNPYPKKISYYDFLNCIKNVA